MRKLFFGFTLLFSGTVNAATVEWTFQNVLFDDGATLTGSFVMGDGINFEDFDLTMSGGSLSSTSYFDKIQLGRWDVATGLLDVRLLEADSADRTGQRVLELAINAPFESPGFAVALSPSIDIAHLVFGAPPGVALSYNREGICGDSTCSKTSVAPARTLVSGTIVGAEVPVPAAAWLFGSALAGLGWMRRKQAV